MSKLFFHAQNKPNGKVWKGPGGLALNTNRSKTGFSIDIGSSGFNPLGSLSSHSQGGKVTWFEEGWQGSIYDYLMIAFSIVNASNESASIRPLILFSSSNSEITKYEMSSSSEYVGYSKGTISGKELMDSFIWGYSEDGTDIEEAGITKEQVSDFIESFKGISFPGIAIKDLKVYGTKDFTSEQVPGKIDLNFFPSGDFNSTTESVFLNTNLMRFVGYLDPVYPDGAYWMARKSGFIGSVNIKNYESLRSSFDSKGYLDLALFVALRNSQIYQWSQEG